MAAASSGDYHNQAIAKAETVSGNAARLGRSVYLCLCKTPGQDRLAALLLLVRRVDVDAADHAFSRACFPSQPGP